MSTTGGGSREGGGVVLHLCRYFATWDLLRETTPWSTSPQFRVKISSATGPLLHFSSRIVSCFTYVCGWLRVSEESRWYQGASGSARVAVCVLFRGFWGCVCAWCLTGVSRASIDRRRSRFLSSSARARGSRHFSRWFLQRVRFVWFPCRCG